MAIEYVSSSVTDTDAPAAGILAQSAMRDNLIAHASGAWTLVEEFNSSGTTIHWVVLKNDGALSDTDIDFYVVIGRNVASGQVGVFVGEEYTEASNVLGVFAPQAGPAYMNGILSDFSYGTGGVEAFFTLGTNFPNAQGQPICPTPPAAATMRYISIVEKDYAIFSINGLMIYIGALIDDIVPGPGVDAAVPIGCFNVLDGGIGNFGALTRHPIDPALAPMSVSSPHSLLPMSNPLVYAERQALGTAIWTRGDRFQGGRVAATEISAIMAAASLSDNANNAGDKVGVIRGRFKNLRFATFPWAATTFDTIVVDGHKHIIMNALGNLDGNMYLQPYDILNKVRQGLVCDTGQVA